MMNLFELVEAKTFEGYFTVQLPVQQWHAYLAKQTIADSMIDKLINGYYKSETMIKK